MPENSSSEAPHLSLTPHVIEEATQSVTEKASFAYHRLNEWSENQAWLPESLQPPLVITLLLSGLLLIAWFAYAVLRPAVIKAIIKVSDKTKFTWDDQLVENGLGRWLTHFFPGLIIYLFSPGLFESEPWLVQLLRIGSTVYLLATGYLLIDSLINSGRAIAAGSAIGKRFNLAIATQLLKLVFALLFLILIISVLIGKSPATLLGGIGVIASVLMLVFKDVILGFVAGIQLSGNRMLSVGDWLEMPSHKADGDVEEIGLTTVKVRNFDKTITTIPTYALISSPFKNWRGMQESEGRRIKRSILIDTNSIQLCTEEMIQRFRQIEHIAAYIDHKAGEIDTANAQLSNKENRVNGRRLTNIGTFRAYIEGYLQNHSDINKDLTLIVRQLAPVGQGLPIELYCFSANKNWAAYEKIQADIFDHLLAVAPEFDLRIFQQPSGSDFQKAFIG